MRKDGRISSQRLLLNLDGLVARVRGTEAIDEERLTSCFYLKFYLPSVQLENNSSNWRGQKEPNVGLQDLGQEMIQAQELMLLQPLK